MKAIVFEKHGSIDNLKYVDYPAPLPEPGKAIVRVRAVALNGFDPMILRKIPGLNIPLPMIPGGDVAGEITYLPSDGTSVDFSLGDRVLIDPLMPQGKGILGETVLGGACELISVPIENLITLPETITFEDAACLPIAYGTAHRMMITRGGVKAGDRVLIMGASGGVGTGCLQLAKMVGAEVAACTSSPEKAEKLRALGADHVINAAPEDFVKAVHDIWGKPRVFGEGGGADLVVNFDGGDSWARSLRVVCHGGKLLTCGATNGYDPQTDLRFIWSLEINIIGSNAWTRADLISLLELVDKEGIKPVYSAIRPLKDLPKSMQELIDRKVFGKLVLLP